MFQFYKKTLGFEDSCQETLILTPKENLKDNLTYRRVVVRFGTSDDLTLRFFSNPGEPTELQNQELIEIS